MVSLQTRPRVLLIGKSCGDPVVDQALRDIAEVVTIPGEDYEEEAKLIREAVEVHGPFDAFGACFIPGDKFPSRWDAGLLAPLAPRCKVYAGPGAGYDKVDVEWISSTGAYYCNAPIAVGRRTADGAIMLLLAAMRGLVIQDRSCRQGKWYDQSSQPKDWRECTLGLLGLGNIGFQIATLAKSLGFKHIIYHTRSPKPQAAHDGFEHVPLDRLWAESDAIVLTCPLNAETRGMVDKRAFGAMKKGVVLVNVARGPVIDEPALLEALAAGIVSCAALDVFENEPEIHPDLLNNYRVILSPHCAAAPSGPQFGRLVNSEVLGNLMVWLKSGQPRSPVNADAVGKVSMRGV